MLFGWGIITKCQKLKVINSSVLAYYTICSFCCRLFAALFCPSSSVASAQFSAAQSVHLLLHLSNFFPPQMSCWTPSLGPRCQLAKLKHIPCTCNVVNLNPVHDLFVLPFPLSPPRSSNLSPAARTRYTRMRKEHLKD